MLAHIYTSGQALNSGVLFFKFKASPADRLEPNLNPAYSLGGSVLGTSSVLDNAYVDARKLVPLLARLAEVETTVYRLAIQIRKTMRRVNALEKVFIPRSEAQVKQIAAMLDENEREDLTRIKLSTTQKKAY